MLIPIKIRISVVDVPVRITNHIVQIDIETVVSLIVGVAVDERKLNVKVEPQIPDVLF